MKTRTRTSMRKMNSSTDASAGQEWNFCGPYCSIDLSPKQLPSFGDGKTTAMNWLDAWVNSPLRYNIRGSR
jgi:hypothetical protein